MNIETTSSLNCAATCYRKYKFKYIDQLQSPNYSSSLGFGTFVHAFAEALKPGGNQNAPSAAVEAELSKFQHQQVDAYNDTVTAIEADFALAKAIAPLWWEYWNNYQGYMSNTQLAFAETEKEWALKSSEHDILVGKRDGVVKHLTFEEGRNTFLHEIKTSGEPHRENYKLRLQMERQISNNIRAIKDEGRDCNGVLYDIIWKPAIRLKKSETKEEFLARKVQCYVDEPHEYFERLFVYRSQRDLDNAGDSLDRQFRMLDSARAYGYPKNESACVQFGSLCEFFTDCMDDRDPQGYCSREQKFPEISKEFQDEVARGT